MRALTFDGSAIRLSHVPRPTPGQNEALVAVHLAGICNTDLELMSGYKEFTGTLGHEFVGTVVEAVDRNLVGRRVCADINVWCGTCPECVANMTTHCRNRTVIGILNRDGVFADYVAVPIRNLHRVPEDIPDRVAVFVEPLAAAFEILEQVNIEAQDRVLVLGDGKLGLLCAQVLVNTGAHVVLIGKHQPKLDLARSFGVPACLIEDVSGESFDVVVEATGSITGLSAALRLVRPRGTVVLKTTVAGETSLDLSTIAVKEVQVIGSRCGPFPKAVLSLSCGEVKVEPLISAVYSLDDGVLAMSHAAVKGTGKVLLDMRSGLDL